MHLAALLAAAALLDPPPVVAQQGSGPAPMLRQEWRPISTANAPSPRNRHTAVWTGSRMVVWGGAADSGTTASGALYDPGTDTWMPTSDAGAPSRRSGHTAVWTGSRMLVWGGWGEESACTATGAEYDPLADRWTLIETAGAPSPRTDHVAVWTGTRMLVWGGYDANGFLTNGGAYDPLTRTWSPITAAGAPIGRFHAAAVWTGSRMFVWGGTFASGIDSYYGTNTGGLYDPATDSWSATSTFVAPNPANDPTAVVSGSKVVVWTGALDWGNGPPYAPNLGGVYDPATNRWNPIRSAPRFEGTGECVSTLSIFRHTAVWTGTRMVVWGGLCTQAGGLFDPSNATWTSTPLLGAPAGRMDHTAVWTGAEMIVWGGWTIVWPNEAYLGTGARWRLVR